MSFTRQRMINEALSYIHDNSLSAEAETWVDLALKDVSRVLRCAEMETTSGIVDLSALPFNVWSFDDGTIEVLDVRHQDTRGDYRYLEPVTRETFDRFDHEGNIDSRFYLIAGRTVQVLDRTKRNAVIGYLKEVQLPASDSTHPAVEAYPSLFLDAIKAQAYDWKEDSERQELFSQRWYVKAVELRDRYESEKYGNNLETRAS